MMASGGGGAGNQDFELNLASIIDCFTVLITFMLATASFLSIGIIDAGVAAAGATPTATTPPAIQISVELAKDNGVTLKVSGKLERTSKLAPTSGQTDLETLARNLTELKAQFPDVAAVTLTAETSVEYEKVVKAMDSMRKSIPVVLLGGF